MSVINIHLIDTKSQRKMQEIAKPIAFLGVYLQF